MEKTAGRLAASFDFLKRLENFYCFKFNVSKYKSRIENMLLFLQDKLKACKK